MSGLSAAVHGLEPNHHSTLQRKVSRALNDPVLQTLIRQGDRTREHQTLHDYQHGTQVRAVAWRLLYANQNITGQIITPEEGWALALAAQYHDIGSVEGAENHEESGARIMEEYLIKNGFPQNVIDLTVPAIRYHRTRSILIRGFQNRVAASVAAGDKMVGDEDRVRENSRRLIENAIRTNLLGVVWETAVKPIAGEIGCHNNYRHDIANFAVKGSRLAIMSSDNEDEGLQESGIAVQQIELDEKILSRGKYIDLFKNRYRAANIAAQYLKLRFLLQFNGRTFYKYTRKSGWKPVEEEVLLP